MSDFFVASLLLHTSLGSTCRVLSSPKASSRSEPAVNHLGTVPLLSNWPQLVLEGAQSQFSVQPCALSCQAAKSSWAEPRWPWWLPLWLTSRSRETPGPLAPWLNRPWVTAKDSWQRAAVSYRGDMSLELQVSTSHLCTLYSPVFRKKFNHSQSLRAFKIASCILSLIIPVLFGWLGPSFNVSFRPYNTLQLVSLCTLLNAMNVNVMPTCLSHNVLVSELDWYRHFFLINVI